MSFKENNSSSLSGQESRVKSMLVLQLSQDPIAQGLLTDVLWPGKKRRKWKVVLIIFILIDCYRATWVGKDDLL